MNCADASAQNFDLLVEGQSRTFSQGAEGDDAGAAVVQQPVTMFRQEAVIDTKIFGKTGGDGREHTLPVHDRPPVTSLCWSCDWAVTAAKVSTRAGNTGGRTESGFQLNRNCVAGPQTRPWHGPMPQRVCSLAARHERCCRRRE